MKQVHVHEMTLLPSLDSSGITSALEQANATSVTPSCNQELSSVNKIPSKCISTEDVLSRQQAINSKQDKGHKFVSSDVACCLNLQKDELRAANYYSYCPLADKF